MKKSIIIACLALISLVSCSNNSSEQEQLVKIADKTQATTEAEVPPTTEPVTQEVLHKDDNCTITYNGFKSLETAQRIDLTIENKTDNSLSVTLSEIKINSISIDQFYKPQLKSKESVSNSIRILNSKLQDENITRVNKIEIKLQITVTDKTNGDCLAYYDTDIITITR